MTLRQAPAGRWHRPCLCPSALLLHCSTGGFVLLGICLSLISLKSGSVELESSLDVNQYDSSAATPAV